MTTDIWAILDDLEEIEEEIDDGEEEQWYQAASMVAVCHGRNYCCAEPCRTVSYTGDGLVQEFLKTHQWRRCQKLLQMPWKNGLQRPHCPGTK
jgi:hypothetical protein